MSGARPPAGDGTAADGTAPAGYHGAHAYARARIARIAHGDARRRRRMTIEQLRAAIRRTLRSYGIAAGLELVDELASIADHHAGEEVAAAVAEEASDLA